MSRMSTKQEAHDRIRLIFDEEGFHLQTLVDGEPQPSFVTPGGGLIEDDEERERVFANDLARRDAWLRAKGIAPEVYMQVIDEQRMLGALDETEELPS